jgi:hypothetical protein
MIYLNPEVIVCLVHTRKCFVGHDFTLKSDILTVKYGVLKIKLVLQFSEGYLIALSVSSII